MSEHIAGSILLQHELHAAWKYATRALNVCESIGLPDTRSAVADIIIRLSQQLEFIESEVQSVRIEIRRDERLGEEADADD